MLITMMTVGCHICNFFQDIKYRPDIQQMMNQGGNESGQIPMQPQQQGYNAAGAAGPGPGPGPGYGGQGYGAPQQGYHPPPNESGGGKPVYG